MWNRIQDIDYARSRIAMPYLGHLFMGLFLLFVFALVVLVIVLAVRSSRHRHPGPGPGPGPGPSPLAGPDENALRILNERYARGEVDDETYRRMKEELRKP